MTSKKKRLYEAIFKCLKKDFKLKPVRSMSDFEQGVMGALRSIWPDTIIDNCFFHFAQLVRKNIFLMPELRKLILKSEKHHKVMKLFIRLPLLPHDLVKEGFSVILQFQEDCNIRQDFEKFNHYFKKNWVSRKVRPIYSVFGIDRRTNNNIECLNGKLKTKFKQSPRIYKFIGTFFKPSKPSYSNKHAINRAIFKTIIKNMRIFTIVYF
jgi:hypothetical protein